jgi:Predicted metal-dependent membrane protease
VVHKLRQYILLAKAWGLDCPPTEGLEVLSILAKLCLVEIANQEPENEITGIPPVQLYTKPFPSPNNPPWGSLTAFAVWIASVVFVFLFPSIFLIPYIAKRSLDFSDKAAVLEFLKSDPTSVLIQLIAVIPAHVLTLVLAWAVVTNLKRYSFRETLGWKLNGFRVWYGFPIFVGFYLVALLLTYIFGSVENDFEQIIKSSRSAVYLVAFFATFTAPIVEEVIYRGLLYSAFQRKFGVVFAVVSITLLFTLVHVPQYSANSNPDWASILTILMLSLTLTLVRLRTGNLLPCIILHTIFNGIQSLLLIVGLYITKPDPQLQEQAAFFLRLIH